MSVFLARRWNRQPSGPVEIDWNNPLAKGMFACALPSGRGGTQADRELVSAKSFSIGQDPGNDAVGVRGLRAWKARRFYGPGWVNCGQVVRSPNAVEYAALVSITADMATWVPEGEHRSIFSNSATNGIGFGAYKSSGVLYPSQRQGSLDDLTVGGFEGMNHTLVGTTPLATDRLYSLHGVLSPSDFMPAGTSGEEMQLGLDGRTEATARYAAYGSESAQFAPHAYYDDPGDPYRVYLAAGWARLRSPAERAEWHLNPWQTFKPRILRIYGGAATGIPVLSLAGVTDITSGSVRPKVTLTF